LKNFNENDWFQAYENYSFEELRFMSPMTRRASETMLVRPNADGSYSANWTPSAAGSFNIHVTIDGYPLDDIYQVDVKEPPSGVLPPIHHVSGRNSTSLSSRLRQFRSRSSGGLRVRAQPSLQGEQIGIVVIDGTITFVEELCNDDGTWLRLSTESIKEWCQQQYSEAWCLQYNQHLGRTLLFPIDSGEASKESEPPVESTSSKSHRIKQQRKDA
jgi:E3 ubiquitin-protein ligase MYCBP2